MSSQIVSLLALVPMLLHSIVGCCWHHSHGNPRDLTTVASASSVDDAVGEATQRGRSTCCQHVHRSSISAPVAHTSNEQSNGQNPHFPCQDEPCGLVPSTFWVASPHVVLDDIALGTTLLEIADLTPCPLFRSGDAALAADNAWLTSFANARRVLLVV